MQMFSEDSKTTVQVDMCQKTICIDEQNVQVTAVTSIYESNDKQLAESLQKAKNEFNCAQRSMLLLPNSSRRLLTSLKAIRSEIA